MLDFETFGYFIIGLLLVWIGIQIYKIIKGKYNGNNI